MTPLRARTPGDKAQKRRQTDQQKILKRKIQCMAYHAFVLLKSYFQYIG